MTLLATSLPVAQWLERPTGGHGFNSHRGLRFFLCPTLVTIWIFHLLISSELNIYHLSFFIITHGAFDIADPSSMQDACHNELSKYDLVRHESPSSSVVRAPDWCYGRSWVRFPSGSQNFSLSYARDKLNTPSFSRIKMLINSFSQDLIYATSVAKANLLNTFCCRMGWKLWLKM